MEAERGGRGGEGRRLRGRQAVEGEIEGRLDDGRGGMKEARWEGWEEKEREEGIDRGEETKSCWDGGRREGRRGGVERKAVRKWRREQEMETERESGGDTGCVRRASPSFLAVMRV